MLPLTRLAILLSWSTTVLAVAIRDSSARAPTATCTTGTPTTTAGYPISYYAQATPTRTFRQGYQPDPSWAQDHLVGSYTFGIPDPVETGFAYAQYKCQYYCEDFGKGGSFFARAADDAQVGSYCHCFDEIIDPATFMSGNKTLVGVWNAICKAASGDTAQNNISASTDGHDGMRQLDGNLMYV